jgi:hypothetical protein
VRVTPMRARSNSAGAPWRPEATSRARRRPRRATRIRSCARAGERVRGAHEIGRHAAHAGRPRSRHLALEHRTCCSASPM